jgi:hypothetical protein
MNVRTPRRTTGFGAVCLLALFLIWGCGLAGIHIGGRVTTAADVQVGLFLNDTVVEYRIGDTLWLNVALSNLQDTVVFMPLVGAAFQLWCDPLPEFIGDEYGFLGIAPSAATDPIRLAPGQDTVVTIGFYPMNESGPPDGHYDLVLRFNWQRSKNLLIPFRGNSSEVLSLSCVR